MKKLFSIVVAAIFTIAGLQNIYAQNKKVRSTSWVATGTFYNDGKVKAQQNWSAVVSEGGKVILAVIEDDGISELYVDGKKIPKTNFSEYYYETKMILDKRILQQEIEKESERLHAAEAELSREDQQVENAWLKIQEIKENLNNLEKQKSLNLSVEKTNLLNLTTENSRMRKLLSAKRAELNLRSKELNEKFKKASTESELNKILQIIISDLKTEGVFAGSENLSFKLSNRELIVNGKRQHDDVFQKMRSRYVPDVLFETGYYYRWEMSS